MKTPTKLAVLFAVIYFVQGIAEPGGGIISLPLQFLLKENMGLDATQASYFLASFTWAWTIKPLYGLISDSLPLFGYRRKSYLVLMNVAVAFSFLTLAFAVSYSYSSLLLILSAVSLGLAFSDVLCDGLMVETGKTLNMTGRFQSIQWISISVASIIAGVGGGYMAQSVSPQHSFLFIAFFPLLTVASAMWFAREERKKISFEHLKNIFGSAKQGLWSKPLWLAAIFIFCWNFSPSFGTPMLYFMTDELHFSKMFIGTLGSIGSVGSIIGAVIFLKIGKKYGLKQLLNMTVLLGVISTIWYLWLVGEKTAIAFSILGGIVSMIALLAILDLAARSCPKMAEGTFFALLMSVYNGGAMVSKVLGGFLLQYTGLQMLIVISAVFTAFCWLFVPFIKTNDERQETNNQ